MQYFEISYFMVKYSGINMIGVLLWKIYITLDFIKIIEV